MRGVIRPSVGITRVVVPASVLLTRVHILTIISDMHAHTLPCKDWSHHFVNRFAKIWTITDVIISWVRRSRVFIHLPIIGIWR